jgi:ZIP family zinc transporter
MDVSAAKQNQLVEVAILTSIPNRKSLISRCFQQALLPESLSSINDLQKEGLSKKQIYLSWSIVSICVALSVVLSFLFLEKLDLNTLGIIESFASGAILAMLADSMMPEAYEEGGYLIGILTILGFLTAFILSKF